MTKLSKRRLREAVAQRLEADRPLDDLLQQVEPQRVLTILLGFTCRPDDRTKMNALAALGGVALRLAEPDGELKPDSDLEPIREFCRRLLWHINEESGGVGWGAPQALAEVLVAAPDLAPDYLPLLWAFLDPDGHSYLEIAELLDQCLWAVGRLAPQTAAPPPLAERLSPLYLASPRAETRALAAWVAGRIKPASAAAPLRALARDQAPVDLYLPQGRYQGPVSRLAAQAMIALSGLSH